VAEQPDTAIRAMFNAIAPDYDRFNTWASLGLHHRWRKTLVSRIPKSSRVLDIATGTGDVAFLSASAGHRVVGLDFSDEMLSRARAKDAAQKIKWVAASAHRLPFSDRSFGCVTSAFALRNIRGTMDASFRESFRVLQPGGKVLHLDFGRPSSPIARWGHRLHLRVAIPFIGQMICRERWPKNYLSSTIEEFFTPEDVQTRLRQAGFSQVRCINLLWGAVRLYEGVRPA